MGDKFLRSLQVNTKVELKKDRKVCESCVDENGKEGNRIGERKRMKEYL